MNWINMTRSGGEVTRFHTCRVVGEQTVATHSFGVANLCVWLTYGKASGTLLRAALEHDLPEQATGDLPAPFKWENPRVKALVDGREETFIHDYGLVDPDNDLSPYERWVLKWADMLELVLFCTEQQTLGNRSLDEIKARGIEYLRGLDPHHRGLELLKRVEAGDDGL